MIKKQTRSRPHTSTLTLALLSIAILLASCDTFAPARHDLFPSIKKAAQRAPEGPPALSPEVAQGQPEALPDAPPPPPGADACMDRAFLGSPDVPPRQREAVALSPCPDPLLELRFDIEP